MGTDFYLRGLFLRNAPLHSSNLKLMIVGIIFVSILPGVLNLFATNALRLAPQNKK